MDDKNLELINQNLDLLFSNIQNSLLQIPNKNLDNVKNKIEIEIKKSIREINTNYDFSSNLPERYYEKYIRIENYEDYEFTHCIAYEMATRNTEVIKLTNIAENLNILNYYLYDSLPISEKWKITINILALKKGIIDTSKISNNSKTINSSLESFNNFKAELDHQIENNLTETDIDSIIESFHNIINKNGDDYLLAIINKYNSINFQTNLISIQGQNLLTIFNNASSKGKISLIQILLDSIELKLEKEYYVVNEQKSITPENIEEYIPKDTNYEPNEAINNHIDNTFTNSFYKENLIQSKNLGYISYQGGYEKDNSFYINEITPNFSQPLRMFNTMKISINPSLPLNDILSFVKKIKEDYDKNETFKSFFELLEEDFSNSENTTIKTKIKYDKSKWADLFYIYDYFKFRKTQSKTIYDIADELSLQLTFYYNNIHNKNNPNNLKPIPENLTNGKLDFNNFSYTKEQDFNSELYLSADQIRKFHYKKISSLIEGENPEYKKLIAGKNHNKNSLIDGKNNVSSGL
ncbi:hypothetical protein [Aliarcobacter butzleri]|uniref:hypothetical protein n=1 Tax=Aliarcobacter butzleri TaxID=28197 RepID=UPI002B242FF2|nr:hypothetical protein [Aliarcobacter butzleri]